MTPMDSSIRPESWLPLLQTHPQVASARLLPGPGTRIEVVPESHVIETVSGWSYLFEDLYSAGVDQGGGRHEQREQQLVGWVDALTRKPVPVEQMREWTQATVDRVLSLRPRRVLEIGAGTGLIMAGLLDGTDIEEYVATDLADASVQVLRSIGARAARHTRVGVSQCAAHEDLPASRGPGYDMVILNSVVQYFPSVRYLEEVIAKLIGLAAPHGHLFLGDVRDSTVLDRHYRRRPDDGEHFDLERHQRRDFELSLSPDYLRSLRDTFDAVSAVEAAPRAGRFHNEMTLFRFDAVLHLGCRPPATQPFTSRGLEADDGAVVRHIASGAGPAVWRAVPNARLEGPVRGALYPERLWGLGSDVGWKVRVGCEPGKGLGALEVWAGPAGTAHDHFGLSLPGVAGAPLPEQPPLPPGRMWSLLDTLKARLNQAPDVGDSAGGEPPVIQLVPRHTGPAGQE
ncbi:class I SAM-dependent methyltransferase [Streptomyces sp. NPDC056405]|uniref:class I SAM-dependent methyltransferase n=1 Tax=Streptomyces sp. NPDC056405 TaxID=3345811 RepID=UPI0035E2926A